MDGFTYNGIHSSAFGCCYIPNAADQGRDTAAYEVEDLEVAGRDGGYYVGNNVKPREFT